MLVAKNEGKACDAVLQRIEICSGEMRSGLWHPELEQDGPQVDLRVTVGTQEYAIEHTLLQPYPNRIDHGTTFNAIYSDEGHPSRQEGHPLLSMTAFCRKQAELERGTLIWEIRSVNHRYLETSIRLPEAFRNLETAIRKTVRGRVKRGKVDCTLRFRESDSLPNELHLNARLLESLATASERIHDSFGDSRLPSSLDILRWPGVIETDAAEDGDLEQEALSLFNGTLDEFLAGRAREGDEIEAAIRERVGSIREILAEVRASLPEILATQRQTLLDNIAGLQVDLEPGRVEQEVALLVNKADIAEELDRLDAHVNEIERLMGAGEPAGRPLDFLMQELMREANTICSKSAAIQTTRNALDLKVLIEQIREQVQNIE